MQKNIYYHVFFQRPNALWEWFLSFIFSICSLPRLALEVFIRRNMGERYFSFFAVICIGLVLIIKPFLSNALSDFFSSPYESYGARRQHLDTWPAIGYVVYGLALLYAGTQRRREVARLPSVFDFERFSLSPGIALPFLYPQFPWGWFAANPRRIATVLEPGLCFLIGLLLLLIKQPVGIFIMVCSIIYALSYVAAYHLGDNIVMNRIDKIICSEEFDAAFNQGLSPNLTRGFSPYGRRPADPNLRRRVVDSLLEEDDDEPMQAQ